MVADEGLQEGGGVTVRSLKCRRAFACRQFDWQIAQRLPERLNGVTRILPGVKKSTFQLVLPIVNHYTGAHDRLNRCAERTQALRRERKALSGLQVRAITLGLANVALIA